MNPGVAPLDPSTLVGQLRALVGDTTHVALDPEVDGKGDYSVWSDVSLESVLILQSGNLLRSAGSLYLQLAAEYAQTQRSIKTDDLSVNTIGRGDTLLKIAQSFFDEAQAADDAAASEVFQIVPFGGRRRRHGRVRPEGTPESSGNDYGVSTPVSAPSGTTYLSGRGKSAYELALDEGYTGTLADWLESLRGDRGLSAYELAVENGFIGAPLEWVSSLEGAQGASAYEIAAGEGFSGTLQEWLESLRAMPDEYAATVNGMSGNVVLDAFSLDATPLDVTQILEQAMTDHAAETVAAHGGIVADTDPRLTDPRTPTAHAATHAEGGPDELSIAASQVHGTFTDAQIPASIARDSEVNAAVAAITVESIGAATAAQGALAETALQPGDLAPELPAGGAPGEVLAKATAADHDFAWIGLPDAVNSVNGMTGDVTVDAESIGAFPASDAAIIISEIANHVAETTNAHGGIVATSDPRLTNARPPTSHAATHTAGGSDPLVIEASQITGTLVEAQIPASIARDSDLPAGVPAGGGTGMVLTKLSPSDFDATWAMPAGGSSSIDGGSPQSTPQDVVQTIDGGTP